MEVGFVINVIDGYGIDVLDNCYAVGKIAKSKKDDREYITSPAYVGSVGAALTFICKVLRRDALKNINCDLGKAVEVIRRSDERLVKAIEEIDAIPQF